VVSDTATAVAFYRDVLGLAIDPSRPALGFPGCWFQLGDQQLHLLEVPNPDPTSGRPAHGGRDRHTAIAVDDLAAYVTRLTEAGIPFTMSRSGRAALFCRDPDGNAWELIEQLSENANQGEACPSES
jgi:glyoxylase I family protein